MAGANGGNARRPTILGAAAGGFDERQSQQLQQQQPPLQQQQQQLLQQHPQQALQAPVPDAGSEMKWTELEKEMFAETLEKFGPDFKAISSFLGTKNVFQCKNYYHNFKKRQAAPPTPVPVPVIVTSSIAATTTASTSSSSSNSVVSVDKQTNDETLEPAKKKQKKVPLSVLETYVSFFANISSFFF
jgi:hypothetical protein